MYQKGIGIPKRKRCNKKEKVYQKGTLNSNVIVVTTKAAKVKLIF